MDSLALDAVDDSLLRWLLTLEARFSIEIEQARHEGFKRSIQHFAATRGVTVTDLHAQLVAEEVTQDIANMILHLATNHETRFFRSPSVTARIVELCRSIGTPRILSVGCSTGEEPYSIAAALLEAGYANFRVHGTDVSPLCIRTARKGVYPDHNGVSPRAAVKNTSGQLRFHRFVRGMVSFEEHNIMHARPIGFTAPNIIVTQNMLIYYRPEARIAILNRLTSLLAPGGFLITGPHETLNWTHRDMTRTRDSFTNEFQRSLDV